MGIYPSTHKTLLKKIQDGDEISWKEFYERYSSVIRTVCMKYGLSANESEDVQQEVMLKFFRNELIFSYREKKSRFRTCFNRIVHNCILDYLRKNHARKIEISGDELPDIPAPANQMEIFDEEWRKQCLQDALDILKDHVEGQTFLAFHMLVFQEKKVKEIADFLQITASQVYLAKSRCIAKMKNIIAELNKEDPELNFQWNKQ